MYPKAYRWVAEMQEIAAFAGEGAGTAQIYAGWPRSMGMAALNEDLAADQAGSRHSIRELDAFLNTP